MDNPLMVRHRGVRIYGVRRDGDENAPLRQFHYGTEPDSREGDPGPDTIFDIREFPGYADGGDHRAILRMAIDELLDRPADAFLAPYAGRP